MTEHTPKLPASSALGQAIAKAMTVMALGLSLCGCDVIGTLGNCNDFAVELLPPPDAQSYPGIEPEMIGAGAQQKRMLDGLNGHSKLLKQQVRYPDGSLRPVGKLKWGRNRSFEEACAQAGGGLFLKD